ncbi:MAG: dihydroneopterin aldolase [Candidatus Omnitrophica bacterium]|nr:dihydroneopterin aldolase [Candidatus Omnitrophota bacterium]
MSSKSLTTVYLKDLAVKAILGTKPHERKTPQTLQINLKFQYDAAACSKSDDLHEAVDYEALRDRVVKLVKASRFLLIEKLAAEIIKVVLLDKKIVSTQVTIDKLSALKGARSVAVRMSGGK